MASGVVVPVLAVTGVSFVNNWYSTGSVDLKIPVAGAIAAALGAGISQIGGLAPVMTAVGWLAFVGYVLASPTLVSNLNKIIGGL